MLTSSALLDNPLFAEALRRAGVLLRKPQVNVAVSEFKQHVARLVDDVDRQTTVIEKHGRPEAVLISYEVYQELRNTLNPSLEALSASFDSALAELQGRTGQAGLEAAFDTEPGEVGRRHLKKHFGGR